MLGWFDPTAVPEAWFDPSLQSAGWFDRELVDVAAGGASFEFTLPGFTFTPSALAPRLTAALTTPAFTFVARAFAPAFARAMTTPAFTFIAGALASTTSQTFSTAAYTFVGQSLTAALDQVYSFTSVSLSLTAQALTYLQQLTHQLTAQVLRFVGSAIDYDSTGGGAGGDWNPRLTRRRRRQ